MAKIKLFRSKKGILFTVIMFLFVLSFTSFFALFELQQTAQSDQALHKAELSKAQAMLGDISATYIDILKLTSLEYTTNTTHQTVTLIGDVSIADHDTLFESLLDTYESGRLKNITGITVNHTSAVNDFILYPYSSYLTIENNNFVYGGGNMSTHQNITLNVTVDEEVDTVTDGFSDDGSGVTVTIRVLDNTSTTYAYSHTLDETQANEQIVINFTSGNELNMTFGSGLFGDGTFRVQDNISVDVNMTGFEIITTDVLTAESGLYTNNTIDFGLIHINFSGGIPLVRG